MPHLEILFQITMTCEKLEQAIKDVIRHAAYEIFRWIEVLSSTSLSLGGVAVLVEFTWHVVV